LPDIWSVLEQRGHKIRRSKVKEFSLTGGKHYWVIDNLKEKSVKCISCPVKHGGIIDAKEAALTTVRDGVIYFKGKPVTEKPEGTFTE